MSTPDKLLVRILLGRSDANVPFEDRCRLLRSMGFQQRVRGDHHIFAKADVEEILALQPRGAKAKPYQVRLVRNTILKHKLGEPRDDQ
ncbi:MAG: toxin HicA, partial [Armatimonadetes bacterium CG_4_9_14_3_um_filter_66_14]